MIETPRFLDEKEAQEQENLLLETESDGSDYVGLETPILFEEGTAPAKKIFSSEGYNKTSKKASWSPNIVMVLIAIGLVFFWFLFGLISLVLSEYEKSHFLGDLSVLILISSLGLLVAFIVREIFSWRTLKDVKRLRKILTSSISNHIDVLVAANEWISLIPTHVTIDHDKCKKELLSYKTSEEVLCHLKNEVLPVINQKILNYTTSSIAQMCSITVISGKPLWGEIATFLNSFILIRRISQLYGIRPGFLTMIVLIRHVLVTTATLVVTAELANLVLKIPVLKAFSGVAERSGLASEEIIRIRKLAQMTSNSCNPLER